MDFDMFFGILIFNPKSGFCIGYSLCMMANFQNGLLSRIFSVFWSGFSWGKLQMICRMEFGIFLQYLFLTQSQDFAWAIAFARWPIFKMVSFIEYLVFLKAVFCTEQLQMICKRYFDMLFGILIFDLKSGSFMVYSLCMMADFQNGLISRIFSVFWSGFFLRTALNDLQNGFWHVFRNFNFWPKVRILHGL